MRIVGIVLFVVTLTALGVGCLVWPSKIQQYALQWPSTARCNPFFNWMKSRGYVLSLRLCGTIAVAMAILLFWGLIRGA
jgi:hypothetical protein